MLHFSICPLYYFIMILTWQLPPYSEFSFPHGARKKYDLLPYAKKFKKNIKISEWIIAHHLTFYIKLGI